MSSDDKQLEILRLNFNFSLSIHSSTWRNLCWTAYDTVPLKYLSTYVYTPCKYTSKYVFMYTYVEANPQGLT